MAKASATGGAKDTLRRIRVRLSERRLDEARFLAALDERSEAAGEIDHDFVRRCLINGFMLFERMGSNASEVDLKHNDSQYTRTDATPSAGEVPSHEGTVTPVAGRGVRQLSGLMGLAGDGRSARDAG